MSMNISMLTGTTNLDATIGVMSHQHHI